MNFNGKPIHKLKLALTTSCNLACSYCYVKDPGKTMSPTTAEKAVDLLLASPGRDKLLSLYGGEPFLQWDLLKAVASGARAKAGRAGKRLLVSVCTNLTLLEDGHLDFLRRADIRVLFSFLGGRAGHDRERRFPGGGGTFRTVLANAGRLRRALKPENLGVSFCVLPDGAGRMRDNFRRIVGLGFNYVNFEIIREYKPWTARAAEAFNSGYKRILAGVLGGIARGEFVYVNPVNWELKYRALTGEAGPACPFRYHLEAYPGGDLAFSPFLLNSPGRKKYVVGNLESGRERLFAGCSFDAGAERCRNCARGYLAGYGSDAGADLVSGLYRSGSLAAAEFIREKAGTDAEFARYAASVRKKVCF